MRKEITFNQSFGNMLNMIRFRKITWQNQSATDSENSIWSHWAVAEWWVNQTETEISANLEFENVFWRSSSEWSSRAYFSPCLMWAHTGDMSEYYLVTWLVYFPSWLHSIFPPRPSPSSPSRLVASMSIKYPAIRLITCNFPCFLNQLKTPIPRLADNLGWVGDFRNMWEL